MSDTWGNPIEEQKPGEQQKPWQKRNQGFPEPEKKDPEEIPILFYEPNNNFNKFKEALSKAALKNEGDSGKLI